jgi:hypothetical protein
VAVGREKDPIDQELGGLHAVSKVKRIGMRRGWTRAEQAVENCIMGDAHRQTTTAKRIFL